MLLTIDSLVSSVVEKFICAYLFVQCGACSSTKDFAVYLEYPDLTGKGQECAVRALASGFNEGVSCFKEVRRWFHRHY